MGFSQPKTPVEPTIRRCKACGRGIRYVAGGHGLKASGWCHVGTLIAGLADWVRCPGKGEPRPA